MNRRVMVFAALLLLGLSVALIAWRFALSQLKTAVESALGPRAEIASIDVGLSGVTIQGLRLRGDPDRWPVSDELRAVRVRVVPDLASAFSALLGRSAWQLHSIRVDDAYLSVLRGRDGAVRVVPGLLDRPARAGSGTSAAAPPWRIGRVQVSGQVDVFDATVRRPPHRLQLTALRLELGPLHLPALDQPVKLALQAALRSAQPGREDGRIEIQGVVTPAAREADLRASARAVDLVALAPYIVKASDMAVKSGTLDLSLQARVERQRLHAPGLLTLSQLELAGGSGPLGTFAGVPAQLVLAAIARDGRVEVPFTLQGRIDDPGFSFNADLGAKLAIGLAEKLGLSVGGVIQGIAGSIRGLFKP